MEHVRSILKHLASIFCSVLCHMAFPSTAQWRLGGVHATLHQRHLYIASGSLMPQEHGPVRQHSPHEAHTDVNAGEHVLVGAATVSPL